MSNDPNGRPDQPLGPRLVGLAGRARRAASRLPIHVLAIPFLFVLLVALDCWHTIRHRPALRRFETEYPALAHIDRTKVPSVGGIRRTASDGRPVLGKPGTMDITHRLSPRAGSTPDQVQIEVEALLTRAGWQRHDEHDWRRPGPHDHLARVGVHRSHSIDGAPEAVNVRIAPTRQPYRR